MCCCRSSEAWGTARASAHRVIRADEHGADEVVLLWLETEEADLAPGGLVRAGVAVKNVELVERVVVVLYGNSQVVTARFGGRIGCVYQTVRFERRVGLLSLHACCVCARSVQRAVHTVHFASSSEKISGDIFWLIGPHHTSLVAASSTTHLSFGERPVNLPVSTITQPESERGRPCRWWRLGEIREHRQAAVATTHKWTAAAAAPLHV